MANAEIRITAKGVDAANRKLKGLGQAFGKLKSAANGMGLSFRRVAIAGVAMAAGMAIVINRTLASIDATAKLSRNIDVSMESLAAFSLQARIGGVSTDIMNKSLGKMMKNIGDAALGFGTAKTILDKLNIDFLELARLSPEKQFAFMADTIANMTTRAEKLSFAVAIFGRQGIGLIEVLEGGSEAFEAAARDTRLFNTAISKVDAKKVEEFNDQFTRLKEVAKGAANIITIRFVEGMKPVIDRLIEGARESGGFKDEVNALANAFTTLAVKSVSAMSKTLKVLKETRQFFARHPILEKIFQIGAAPLSLPFTGAEKGRNIVTGSFPDERPQVPKRNNFLADAQKAIDAARKDDQLRKTRITDFQKEAQAAIKKADMAVLQISLDKRGLVLRKEMRTAQEKHNDKIKELNDLLASGAITQETFSRASKKAMEDFNSATDKVKTSLIDIKAVGKEVAASMQRNFSDFFFNLGTEVNSFEDLWKSTLSSIRRALADFASQALIKSLFSGLGGGGGGSGKKGIFGLGGFLGIFHEGGVVGSGGQPTRQLSFAGIPRMHSGGLAGDEVPAILKKKEGVLSLKGMANLDKLNLGNAGGGGSGLNITVLAPVIIQAIDTQTGLDFLMKPENSEAFETNIERALLDNGRIRDAIEQARK